MPKVKNLTERRVVDLSSAMARQLKRLSRYHDRSIADLIREAVRQTYGQPKEQDRHPLLFDEAQSAKGKE